MRHTAVVAIVIAHGAGSTGAAARALLGLPSGPGIVDVEDRRGDVGQFADRIGEAVTRDPRCTHVIGVSLGAHALVRWAAGRPDAPHLICVLPAWTGDPAGHVSPTAIAADQIAEQGIRGTLATLEASRPRDDVTDLLALAWAEYTDDQLQLCLRAAASSRAPTPTELVEIMSPTSVLGWYGDTFHPVSVALEWARHIPRARVALAARPRMSLLQRALAESMRTTPGPLHPDRPGEGASSAPRPSS